MKTRSLNEIEDILISIAESRAKDNGVESESTKNAKSFPVKTCKELDFPDEWIAEQLKPYVEPREYTNFRLDEGVLPTDDAILNLLKRNNLEINTLFNIEFGISIDCNSYIETVKNMESDRWYAHKPSKFGTRESANVLGFCLGVYDPTDSDTIKCITYLSSQFGIYGLDPDFIYSGTPEEMLEDLPFCKSFLPTLSPDILYTTSKDLYLNADVSEDEDIKTMFIAKGTDIRFRTSEHEVNKGAGDYETIIFRLRAVPIGTNMKTVDGSEYILADILLPVTDWSTKEGNLIGNIYDMVF